MTDSTPTQRRNLPLLATTELCSGGTYIVTGANTGLGLEAARHLVQLGAAKVIMGVRNVTAGEEARADIQETTGISNVAEVWALDLSSYSSVKAFAKRAIEELDRIDALIENAAVAMSKRVLAEGHTLPVTVNVYSTFLLGFLLLPKMSESSKRYSITSHLSIVTSSASFDFREDWEKIKDNPLGQMDVDETAQLKTYPLTKLVEIMAIKHLASLIPVSDTGVAINLVCPGLCKTSLSRNAPPAFREHLAAQHAQYGRTAEDGSRTLLYGAVAGKDSHGCFLDSCEIAEAKLPAWITNEEGKEAQKRAWDVIANELESVEPGCVKRILKQ